MITCVLVGRGLLLDAIGGLIGFGGCVHGAWLIDFTGLIFIDWANAFYYGLPARAWGHESVTALRLPAFSRLLGAGQCYLAHQALGVSRPTRSSSPWVSCRPLGDGNPTRLSSPLGALVVGGMAATRDRIEGP